MKRTAQKPREGSFDRISSYIWGGIVDDSIKGLPCVNEQGELILFEQDSDVPVIMKPGERRIHVKQRQFMRACGKYPFVLYGGAMRGGKSYIGLWNCVYWLMRWYKELGLVNVRVGIFCETYDSLFNRQISMLSRYLPAGLGKYKANTRIFKLKRKFGGGEIYFRNLDKPEKYKSVNFAHIFIDEINENGTQDVVDILRTRLQWPGIKHCSLSAACNPGGPGHGWVYDLCINKESDTYIKPIKDADGSELPGVFFIQARPDENPYLEPTYYARLKGLPEKKYKMWVLGDWNSFEGQFFDQFELGVHVIPRKKLPEGWRRYRAMDLGRAHPFVCLWGAVSPKGVLYVYREFSTVGKSASYCKRQIAHLSRGETYECTIGPHDMNRRYSTPDGEKTVREIFNSDANGGDFQIIIGDKNRRGRIDALYDAMSFERNKSYVDEAGVLQPGDGFKHRPRIQIMSNCKHTISSIRLMQHDKHDPEVYAKTNAKNPGQGDDETDTLALLWQVAESSTKSENFFELDDMSDIVRYDEALLKRDLAQREQRKNELEKLGLTGSALYDDDEEAIYDGESSYSNF